MGGDKGLTLSQAPSRSRKDKALKGILSYPSVNRVDRTVLTRHYNPIRGREQSEKAPYRRGLLLPLARLHLVGRSCHHMHRHRQRNEGQLVLHVLIFPVRRCRECREPLKANTKQRHRIVL